MSRDKQIEALESAYKHYLTMHDDTACGVINSCIDTVKNTPTADVVEVVRCKDCVFSEKGFDEGDVYCKLNDVSFGKDSFCSYGERREQNGG